MPNFTSFLKLSLPSLGEFVDSWNDPVNENFEDLDDWTKDLFLSLVGAGVGSTWSALRGSLNSLSERLDVSIAADGSIDVSGSQGILDMATSAFTGQFDNPRDRLNSSDSEVFDAGPSAGFPEELLDSGIAIRSADFGANSAEPISSPTKPWAPGLVVGGADPLLTGSGVAGEIQINAGSVPAIFNIDGYIFRIFEDILFDYGNLAGLVANDFVWIYVERKEANYNTAAFRYSEFGGTPVAKDLRKLESGTNGVTSNSTFTSFGATFDTNPFKVKPGHILRITSGTAAGDYVIDALDGTVPNTKLTIRGLFKTNVSGANFDIIDNAMPNIGAAIATSTPSDETSQPPFEEGRVYIGRIKHLGGGSPNPRVSFARGGVHDSGWLPITDISTDFPLDVDHELGVIPSSIEIWVRESSSDRSYRPIVKRQILTNFDEGNTTVDVGDAKKDDLLFPSLFTNTSEIQATITVLNESTDPAKPPALFTDIGGVDKLTGEIRVISRR